MYQATLKAHSHNVRLTCAAVTDTWIAAEIENFLIFRTATVFCSPMHQMLIMWN